MDSTLAGLIADVRRKGAIPAFGGTGSEDSDLLSHLNDSLMDMAAEVIKCREGFYRAYKDHTLVSGTVRYRVPTRAIGNRLAAVLLLDTQGKTVASLTEWSYTRLAEEGNSTDCAGYLLEAGDVVLVPAFPTNAVATLRMVFHARPGEMTSSLDVVNGDCYTVTAVAGNLITVAAAHNITTAQRIDIIKGGPPCEHIAIDILPSAVGASTFTVADASRVEVGDFVCRADKAPKPQLPDAFYPPLAALAAQEFWSAQGSSEDVKRLEGLLYGKDGLVPHAVALIAPRVEEGGKKIMSIRGSVLGGRRGTYGRY